MIQYSLPFVRGMVIGQKESLAANGDGAVVNDLRYEETSVKEFVA